MAATSSRREPTGVAPANTAAAPDAGYAHTCTTSTPLSVAATSSAHPATPNGCRTAAPAAGRSTLMYACGAPAPLTVIVAAADAALAPRLSMATASMV